MQTQLSRTFPVHSCEIRIDIIPVALNKQQKRCIMTISFTRTDVNDLNVICKLDKSIYSCISKDIVSEIVILNPERISHIQSHHPKDYERYNQYIPAIIGQPDYIIETDRKNTAFVLKEFSEDGHQFRLILRLHTAADDPKLQNSIITFQYIRPKEYQRLIKNKKILYKRPEIC